MLLKTRKKERKKERSVSSRQLTSKLSLVAFIAMVMVSQPVVNALSTPSTIPLVVMMGDSLEERTTLKTIQEHHNNVKVVNYRSLIYTIEILRSVGEVFYIGHGTTEGILFQQKIISYDQLYNARSQQVFFLSCGSPTLAEIVISPTINRVDAIEVGLFASTILANNRNDKQKLFSLVKTSIVRNIGLSLGIFHGLYLIGMDKLPTAVDGGASTKSSYASLTTNVFSWVIDLADLIDININEGPIKFSLQTDKISYNTIKLSSSILPTMNLVLESYGLGIRFEITIPKFITVDWGLSIDRTSYLTVKASNGSPSFIKSFLKVGVLSIAASLTGIAVDRTIDLIQNMASTGSFLKATAAAISLGIGAVIGSALANLGANALANLFGNAILNEGVPSIDPELNTEELLGLGALAGMFAVIVAVIKDALDPDPENWQSMVISVIMILVAEIVGFFASVNCLKKVGYSFNL